MEWGWVAHCYLLIICYRANIFEEVGTPNLDFQANCNAAATNAKIIALWKKMSFVEKEFWKGYQKMFPSLSHFVIKIGEDVQQTQQQTNSSVSMFNENFSI